MVRAYGRKGEKGDEDDGDNDGDEGPHSTLRRYLVVGAAERRERRDAALFLCVVGRLRYLELEYGGVSLSSV